MRYLLILAAVCTLLIVERGFGQSMAEVERAFNDGEDAYKRGQYKLALERFKASYDDASVSWNFASRSKAASEGAYFLLKRPQAMERVADMQLLLGDLDGAEKSVLQAIGDCEEAWHRAHPFAVLLVQKLAAVHTRRGDMAEAEMLYRWTVSVLQSSQDPALRENAMVGYGQFLDYLGDHQRADDVFKECAPARVDASASAVGFLLKRATHLQASHRLPDAKSDLELALRLAGEGKVSGALTSRAEAALANVLRLQGQNREAEMVFVSAVEHMTEEEELSRSLNFAMLLHQRAGNWIAMGDLDLAESALDQCGKILTQGFEIGDLAVGAFQSRMGDLRAAQGRSAEADQLYQWSIANLEANRIRDSALTILDTLRSRALLLRKMGKVDEAIVVEVQAAAIQTAGKQTQDELVQRRRNMRLADPAEFENRVALFRNASASSAEAGVRRLADRVESPADAKRQWNAMIPRFNAMTDHQAIWFSMWN